MKRKKKITEQQIVDSNGFIEGNHPICPHCHEPSRCAVLMFLDENHFWKDKQEEIYGTWERSIMEYMKINKQSKICVLEIGCGKLVPIMRQNTKNLILETKRNQDSKNPNISLIRINPEFSEKSKEEDYECNYDYIGIKGGALESLKKIDSYIQDL